jgi:hypothetical protein
MQTDLPDDPVHPTSTTRATVKAVEPADLISFIRHTLGFPPRNSLTAISLAGNTLGAVLRCDWDPSLATTAAEHAGYARQFARTLSRDQRADGCVVVLFRQGTGEGKPPRTAKDPTSPSDRVLAAALERELAAVGLPVVETWLVAAGHVWHVDCPDPATCSAHGSPAALADTSVLNAALVFEGSVVEDEPEGSGLPAAAREWSAELATALRELLEVDDDDATDCTAEWLAAWEGVLAGGAIPAHPSERAFLLAGLARVQWRDCLVAAASFGLDRAVSGAAWLGTVPVAVAESFGAEPREVNGVLFSSVILARTRRAPDWQRIARLRSACTELLPDAACPVASAVRCLVAWVEWARGRGSTAGRIVDECRLEDPGYPLGQLLGEILDRGILAGWAGRRDTAWSASGRPR